MNTLDSLLQLVAPHFCLHCKKAGLLLCSDFSVQLLESIPSSCYRCNRITKNSKTCRSCRASSALYAVHAVTRYQTYAKRLVHEIKFGNKRAGCWVAANKMSLLLDRGYSYIVPLPTAPSRVRQRGFDHSVLIAESIAGQTTTPFLRVLRRNGSSRQVGATRLRRTTQLQDAYSIKRPLKASHVLLVDDVVSTGASLDAAARALRTAGVKRVSAVVFARS